MGGLRGVGPGVVAVGGEVQEAGVGGEEAGKMGSEHRLVSP